MSIQLGDEVPNVKKMATTQGTIEDFHQWIGDNWCVLFSHPKDFTPVCTTELGFVAKIMPEFEERGVKVLALSVDNLEDHQSWVKDINETQGVDVQYPIIADCERKMAHTYGMIHPNELTNLTVRTVFIIGPDKKVKLMLTYPASTGRNFHEILRCIDSLQLTHNHQVATPANWSDGEKCIVVPSLTDEEAKKNFPKGFTKVKNYLRYTPDPRN